MGSIEKLNLKNKRGGRLYLKYENDYLYMQSIYNEKDKTLTSQKINEFFCSVWEIDKDSETIAISFYQQLNLLYIDEILMKAKILDFEEEILNIKSRRKEDLQKKKSIGENMFKIKKNIGITKRKILEYLLCNNIIKSIENTENKEKLKKKIKLAYLSLQLYK